MWLHSDLPEKALCNLNCISFFSELKNLFLSKQDPGLLPQQRGGPAGPGQPVLGKVRNYFGRCRKIYAKNWEKIIWQVLRRRPDQVQRQRRHQAAPGGR